MQNGIFFEKYYLNFKVLFVFITNCSVLRKTFRFERIALQISEGDCCKTDK